MDLFRRHTSILIMMSLLGLAACSDDIQEQPSGGDGTTRVHMRITPYGSSSRTRWADSENAKDDEMMNLWTVVVVDNADNKVKSVRAANPTTGDKQEIDDLETTVNLTSGHTYRFYSFANIHPKLIMALMKGSASLGRTRADGDIPVNFPTNDPAGRTNPENPNNASSPDLISPNNPPYSTELTGVAGYNFSSGVTGDGNHVAELIDETGYEDFKTMTVDATKMQNVLLSVDGNGFNPSADNNIYGAKGIPMSNVQEMTVSGIDTNIDLIVVRGMAKIELRLYNETASDLYVRSVTLTNLTANTVGNLRLLPTLSHEDDMEATHKDVRPHLGNSFRQHFTYSLPTAQPVAKVNTDEVAAQQTAYQSGAVFKNQKVTFYVNESQLASTSDRYYITLGVSKGSSGPVSEYRYAIITGKNSMGDAVTDWSYISRNDYRIIPLVLDDYKLDLIPYDFPPIGVYPCSVVEGDVYNTLTFHDYGHFHLLPLVTKYSETAEIPYNDTSADVYWTLGASSSDDPTTFANATLSDQLKWFTDASFTTQATANASGFYRKDADGGSSTADADDAGGVPRWDNNLIWKPTDATSYRPFIYGYIAEHASLTADISEYHTFTVKLWKKGASESFRDLTCYFRMVLSKDQLGMARRRGVGTARHMPHSR